RATPDRPEVGLLTGSKTWTSVSAPPHPPPPNDFRLPVFDHVESEGDPCPWLQELSAPFREFDGHYFTSSRDSEECPVADDSDQAVRLHYVGLKVDDVGFPSDVERERPARNTIGFGDTGESEPNRLREVVGDFRDSKRGGLRVRSAEVA